MLVLEVCAKLADFMLLASPFFRRGTEGVGYLILSLYIKVKSFKPPQSPLPSWALLLVKKGEVKSKKVENHQTNLREVYND